MLIQVRLEGFDHRRHHGAGVPDEALENAGRLAGTAC